MVKRADKLREAGETFRLDPDVGRTVIGDTIVSVWQDADGYYLSVSPHGNEILYAARTLDGIINVTVRTCGWPTNLTRNVLNAVLLGLNIKHRIVRRNGELLLSMAPPYEGAEHQIDEQDWTHINQE